MRFTPDIEVMLRPERAYAEYAGREAQAGSWSALRRMAFVALIQGVVLAMAATQTVAAPVVASLTACWSAAVLVQLLAASLFIASAPDRTVRFPRALDLFYLGHAPWSLWLLVCAGVLAGPLPHFTWLVLLTMAAPAALSARIMMAFAQQVLGLDRSAAMRRTVLHQTAIWAVLLGYFGGAVALWPRIVGALHR